jgi:hypothetical protein
MCGTYLRLDIIVHDSWRTVVRAASRKLSRRARRDPAQRAGAKAVLSRHARFSPLGPGGRPYLASLTPWRRDIQTFRLPRRVWGEGPDMSC